MMNRWMKKGIAMFVICSVLMSETVYAVPVNENLELNTLDDKDNSLSKYEMNEEDNNLSKLDVKTEEDIDVEQEGEGATPTEINPELEDSSETEPSTDEEAPSETEPSTDEEGPSEAEPGTDEEGSYETESGTEGKEPTETEEYTDAELGTETEAYTEIETETETESVIEVLAEDNMFPGLPEGEALSAQQLSMKRELAESNIATELENLEADVDYLAGEVVYLTEERSDAELAAKAYGGELLSFEQSVAVISIPEEITVQEAIEAAADEDTMLPPVYANLIYTLDPAEDVEEERLVTMSVTEQPQLQDWESYIDSLGEGADPYIKNPAATAFQWMHSSMNNYAAWGETLGDGIIVAVIDSGINSGHQDLQGKVIRHENFTTDTISGENYDGHSHGTHCAGIVAAKQGNGKNGCGVAPEASLIDIKVLNASGGGSTSNLVRGITYVVEKTDADIISMSVGIHSNDLGLKQKVDEAIDKGIILVASAGNDGTNAAVYPSSYEDVIRVASIDASGAKSYFSNYGSSITIAAPGSEIYSTSNTSNTGAKKKSGTSMAAPAVAGALALFLSARGKSMSEPADMDGDGDADRNDVRLIIKHLVNSGTKAQTTEFDKVINTANLVETEVAAPQIHFLDHNTELSTDNIMSLHNSLYMEMDTSGYTVYTIDGTTPSRTNGFIYTDKVNMRSFPKGNVTIKAITISGMDKCSDVAKVTVKLVEDTIPVTQIVVTEKTECLAVGKSFTFAATALGAGDESASNSELLWELSDEKYASISNAGKLQVAEDAPAGTILKITVKAAGNTLISQILTVVVASQTVYTVDLGGNQTISGINNELELQPVLQDKNKNTLSLSNYTKSMTYTSSNEAVASVDQQGKVTATGYGTAKITLQMKDGDSKKGVCTISVIPEATAGKVTRISMQVATKNMSTQDNLTDYEKTYDLKKIVNIVSTGTVNPVYQWKSSKNSVATVNEEGVVTAIAPGTTKITLKVSDGYSTKSTSINIKVYQMIQGIDLQAVNTLPGKKVQIKAVITPSNATNKKLTWNISTQAEEAGVKISANGLLTIPENYKEERIQVTVFAKDEGKLMASQTVKIYQQRANAITMSQKTYVLGTTASGELLTTATLQPTIAPSNACQEVTYKTENKKVCTVDEQGVITAVGAGTTRITIRAVDGSNRNTRITVKVVNPVLKEFLQIEGPDALARGYAVAYKATMNSTASSKKITWSVDDAAKAAGVKINSKGSVKVPAGSTLTAMTIYATAADGTALCKEKSVKITKDKVTKIVLTAEDNVRYVKKNNAVKTINLYTVNVNGSIYGDTNTSKASVTPAFTGGENTAVTYKSSNAKVATVDDAGNIQGISAGKAVITCTTTDGSKKHASVNVVVTVPASSVVIKAKKETYFHRIGESSLAYGKALQLSAIPGNVYGNVKNFKATWTVKLRGYNKDGEWEDISEAYAGQFKISQSGKVRTSNGLSKKIVSAGYTESMLQITATAKDGTLKDATFSIYLQNPVKSIKYKDFYYDSADRCYYMRVLTDSQYGDFKVTTTDARKVGVTEYTFYYDEEGSELFIKLVVTGEKIGNTTVVVKAMDGYGRTFRKNVYTDGKTIIVK